MASDTGELKAAAERLERVNKVLSGDWTAAGHRVGKMAKAEAKDVAAEVTGGSGMLRNMGRGTRLSSGYELEDRGRRMTLTLRPRGPWVIFEQGARGHVIGVKKSRARGGGSGWGITPAIYARGYDHPTSKPFTHPGARTKRGAIRKTFARVRAKGSETYHTEMVKQIGQIYG